MKCDWLVLVHGEIRLVSINQEKNVIEYSWVEDEKWLAKKYNLPMNNPAHETWAFARFYEK